MATGFYDFPRFPPLFSTWKQRSNSIEMLHSRDWKGPEGYVGKRVLIVGGATSSVEIAEECVRGGIHPTLVVRGKLQISPQRIFGIDLHDITFSLEVGDLHFE